MWNFGPWCKEGRLPVNRGSLYTIAYLEILGEARPYVDSVECLPKNWFQGESDQLPKTKGEVLRVHEELFIILS
jgi:hypothetical protein